MSEEKKIFNALLARNFSLFLEKVFETLHPEELFEESWHLDVFARYVNEIVGGRMLRLVVAAPPRSLKSLTFNIALSAWILGLNPKARILGISCTKDLARKHSNDTRKVMESDWYRAAFPKTKLRKNTEDYIETTLGGFRRAASPEVGVTGKGATHIIVDDLVDANDADKVHVLIARFDWLMKSVMSRFDNPNKGVFLAIGQRLHIEDPSGALIKMPGFKLLKIPAIMQQSEEYQGLQYLYTVEEGVILQESLASEETLAALRAGTGESAFFAQYLQEPIPDGGGLLAFSSFARLAKQPRGVVHLSVDTGQTKGSGDYSVIMAIGYEKQRFHILDIYREQLDFEGLRVALLHQIQLHKPAGVLIETTGGYGGALLDTLRNNHGVQNLHPYKPVMSKQERFYKAWPIIQGGDVTLPESAPWLPEFRKEFVSFPAGKHDDQLDALSQLLMNAKLLLKKAGCEAPEKYYSNLLKVNLYGFN